jgi:hypothetical protein
MPTSFPASLDALANPTAIDPLNSPSVPHAAQHANANDAIEALQNKVGIDNSSDVNSLDYKVRVLPEQSDIGTAPNQIPLNQYLGTLAYMDSLSVNLESGTGLLLGKVNALCKGTVTNSDEVKTAKIIVDLHDLVQGGTAGDIIGSDSTTIGAVRQPAYLAQIPAGMSVLGGRMTCLEAPSTGSTDIDLYAAAEGTGLQDGAIADLTETLIIDAGVQSLGTQTWFAANPAAGSYLYLVGNGSSVATYTAGRFLIEFYGL